MITEMKISLELKFLLLTLADGQDENLFRQNTEDIYPDYALNLSETLTMSL